MDKTYRVREMKNGRSGERSYVVVMVRPGKPPARVTVHAARTRDQAQAEADEYNIGSMVADFDADPRPYHVRQAEAEAAYRARK